MFIFLVVSLRMFTDPWELARFPRPRKFCDSFPPFMLFIPLTVGSQGLLGAFLPVSSLACNSFQGLWSVKGLLLFLKPGQDYLYELPQHLFSDWLDYFSEVLSPTWSLWDGNTFCRAPFLSWPHQTVKSTDCQLIALFSTMSRGINCSTNYFNQILVPFKGLVSEMSDWYFFWVQVGSFPANQTKKKVKVTQLCLTLLQPHVARQAPPPWNFPREECWSGLPFPSPGDLSTQGLNLGLQHCRLILNYLSHRGNQTRETCSTSCGTSLRGQRKSVPLGRG